MARQYGNNTDAAKEAAEFAKNERTKYKKLQRKVEIGVFIFLLVFGMIILFNKMSEASDINDAASKSLDDTQRIIDAYAKEAEEIQEKQSDVVIEVDASTVVHQRWIANNAYKAGTLLVTKQNELFADVQEKVNENPSYNYSKTFLDLETVEAVLPSYIDTHSHKIKDRVATKMWCMDLPLSNDYEWFFYTDFDFENSYIDERDGRTYYDVRPMSVAFLCYAKSDVFKKHLVAFATAKYNCPTSTSPDGHFTDVKVYRLTGWGMTDAQRVKRGDAPLSVGAFDDKPTSAPASVSIEPEGGDAHGGSDDEA